MHLRGPERWPISLLPGRRRVRKGAGKGAQLESWPLWRCFGPKNSGNMSPFGRISMYLASKQGEYVDFRRFFQNVGLTLPGGTSRAPAVRPHRPNERRHGASHYAGDVTVARHAGTSSDTRGTARIGFPDMTTPKRPQSRGEEIANSVSHGLGAVGAVAALPLLLAGLTESSSPLVVVGVVVFALSALFLYGASSTYHALGHGRAKRILRHLDHIGIFVLIAGSYTPFMLGPLRGPWGWSLLAAVWTLALLGILFKVHPRLRRDHAPVWLYLLMGWLVVVAIRPMWSELTPDVLAWIAAGGIAYTGGVVFYALDRKRYFHLVWHLCVLAGTGCHFVALRLAIA